MNFYQQVTRENKDKQDKLCAPEWLMFISECFIRIVETI